MDPLLTVLVEEFAARSALFRDPAWPLAAGAAAAIAWHRGGRRSDRVREPILAGAWYPSDPAALAQSIDRYLDGHGRPESPLPSGTAEAAARSRAGRHPRALIVPHAGHQYSGAAAGGAFGLLRTGTVRRVLLLGPSHRVRFRGAALPEERAFRTPLGEVRIDSEAAARLLECGVVQEWSRAHAAEHSLEVELPFLQRALPGGFGLVPLVIGALESADVQSLAESLARLWDEESVVVVSSDFTHYGASFEYQPFVDDVPERIRELDAGALERILALDRDGFEGYRERTDATICGAEPIRVLLEAARGRGLVGTLVDYYRSGDLTDDFDHTVSYAAVAFFEPEAAPPARPLEESERQFLLRLARDTLGALVRGAPLPAPEPAGFPADSPLHESRGVFVTLTTASDRRLRGCIGNILGEMPLWRGVQQNTVAAASHDPRFVPVSADEEPGLHIEISVLTPPRRVAVPAEIRIGLDGIVLEKGGRRAVFLPQVALEMGWDLAETLRHLSRKAGLPPDAWGSEARFQTFQAQVFEEHSPT